MPTLAWPNRATVAADFGLPDADSAVTAPPGQEAMPDADSFVHGRAALGLVSLLTLAGHSVLTLTRSWLGDSDVVVESFCLLKAKSYKITI
jgi:hypothetical protein